MENMFLTAIAQPISAGPNPLFAVYFVPANYDWVQDIANIIVGKAYEYNVVQNSPVPALTGGTFLSTEDALTYFLTNDLATIIANTVDSVNAYYGVSVYQYAGYIQWSMPLNDEFASISTVGYSGSYSDLLGKPTLATVATSGSYSDLSGKPSIPSTARTTSVLSLAIVTTGATGTQIHATKDSTVRCTVSTSTTSTIGGASTSLVSLKMCATNSATEGNWTTVATLENDQTISLALALQSIQVMKGQLTADVPGSWYVKLTNSGSGTHSETSITGQQTIYG